MRFLSGLLLLGRVYSEYLLLHECKSVFEGTSPRVELLSNGRCERPSSGKTRWRRSRGRMAPASSPLKFAASWDSFSGCLRSTLFVHYSHTLLPFFVCGCFIFGGFTAQLKCNSSPGTLYGSISTVRLMERSVWTWAAALDLDFRPGCGSFSPFDRAQVTYCFELQCLPLYSSENASASVHYMVAEKEKSLQDRVKRKLRRHVRNSERKGSRPWTQSRVW